MDKTTFYLANRMVHSVASSSCLTLSLKYKRAILGTSGLSARMRNKHVWGYLKGSHLRKIAEENKSTYMDQD